tara:strand:- start:2793 stop:3242 length:450 start_codon:yes stop_codon:yes gene_type:complete
MSIKALVLEGGETVIADVQEVHDKEKQEFLGYRVSNPYVVEVDWSDTPPAQVDGTDLTGDAESGEVKFRYWGPLARERDFDFVKDFVRVIYEAHPDTVQLYMSVLAHHQEHFRREVQVDTSKTVVTMLPEDGAPENQLGANDPSQSFDS